MNMKLIVKTLNNVGLLTIGYFVGFYEMKYKLIKTMLEGELKAKTENKENDESKD